MGERTIPELVAEYTAAGAPCISVVTGRWFGGDDQMLLDVAGLTDLPLLKKDFITRESQIDGRQGDGRVGDPADRPDPARRRRCRS